MKLLPISFINYPPVRVSLDFLWYDLWVGAFWDRKSKTLYVCPLPCVVIKAEFAAPKPATPRFNATSLGSGPPITLANSVGPWQSYLEGFGDVPACLQDPVQQPPTAEPTFFDTSTEYLP